MIELGLPLRGQFYANSMNAVYAFFSSRWGAFGEKGFSGIPNYLQALKPAFIRRKKFLGGLFDLDIKTVWNVDSDENWEIKYRRSLGKKPVFKTKSSCEFAVDFSRKLNNDLQLIKILEQVDLVAVNINQKEHVVSLSVIPMGGGICYMYIPPVRYALPLPYSQLNKLAWSIERMAGKIVKATSASWQSEKKAV